jgi:hypothetical protein
MTPRAFLLALAALLFTPATGFAEEGWESLFDGKSLDGWTGRNGRPVTAGWKVEEGAIHRAGAGGDLLSAKEYLNFELEFEWKVAPGANSGLKYRVTEYAPVGRHVGLEYQVLDDKGHDNGRNAKTAAGSLYDLIPPAGAKQLNPAGEWNRSKVVARGGQIEHWLNGSRILSVDLAGEAWKKALAGSKFRAAADFGTRKGRILLQDHGDEAWFRNLRIRPLPDT